MAHCSPVFYCAVCQGRDETEFCVLNPDVELRIMLLSDDRVESCDDASRFDEQRDAAFYAAIVTDFDSESVSRPVVISGRSAR